jgi:aconitate hydratase
VKAVIAETFERIHRSNLVNMGVLPLQFPAGQTAASLGLTGREEYAVVGIASGLRPAGTVKVRAARADGQAVEFDATVRIDTPEELVAFRHGGILPYVLRQLAGQTPASA